MTAIVEGASGAATFGSNLSKVGNLNGRSLKHWSFPIHAGITIVGVIVAIAGWILGANPILVSGIVLCATNLLAAYHAKKFGILQTLEQDIKVMEQKVDELKKVNKDLKEINEAFSNIPDDYRKAILEGRKMMDEKIKEIEGLTEKLEKTEKRLQKLGAIANKLKSVSGKLSEEAVRLGKENGQLGENIDKLITDNK